MEVVLLGTGAAMPTRHRRPSALAVIRAGEILLFDCGEGTQIQFQKALLKPGKLTKIFISHLHGDHFYGLIGLLTSLQLAGRERELEVFGPAGLSNYLSFMQKLSRFTFRFEVSVVEVPESASDQNWDFGEYCVLTKALDHSLFSLGFRIEEKPKPGKFDVNAAARLGLPEGPLRRRLQKGQPVVLPSGKKIEPGEVLGSPRSGKKIAICLDSRPCAQAVELAQDADLLIHDGSFDNSKQEWANSTGHSTVSQAAQIAQTAQVKRLLLTHISARYKPEEDDALLAEATVVFPETVLGQDLMRLQV